MATRERPLSPFLIYRPQLTSVLSFAHRLTGVALSIGALLLTGWLHAVAAGPQRYAAVTAFLAGPAGLALLGIFSACLFYHLCNGIRHLAWDLGFGFEIRRVYASGWAVVGATLLLTLGFWWLALGRGT